jgi:protein phosphatase
MGLFKKMFGRKKDRAHQPHAGEPATEALQQADSAPAETSGRTAIPHLHVGSTSDVGQVRTHNEDVVFTLKSEHLGDGASGLMGLFILADGMGGHQAGEVASSLAARTVANEVIRQIYLPYLVTGHLDEPQQPLEQALSRAVDEASKMVYNTVPGGGTTLTCTLIFRNHAILAHVGDSRAYLYYEGALRQITKDHSYVDKLVELGRLTAEEAAVHPQKNVLYRAVGQKDMLEVDIYTETIVPGSRMLLCSDGLWSMVSEEQIMHILSDETLTPQAACDKLVGAANAAGGHDNITAIIVEMSR